MKSGPESGQTDPDLILRRVLVAAGYVLLLSGGLWLGGRLPDWIEAAGVSDRLMLGALAGIFALYVLMTAIPFVPGAEIGLGLMLTFGAVAVPFVYLGMVASLLIAFWLGRLVPPGPLAVFFQSIGMSRAALRVVELADLAPEDRGALLAGSARPGILGTILRYRYIALIAALNIPGNALIGGAGGIGLMSGMCGLHRPGSYAAAVALGVLPGPAIFLAATHVML